MPAPLLLLMLVLSACGGDRPAATEDAAGAAASGAAAPADTTVPAPSADAPAADASPPALRVETLDHGVFDLRDQAGRWVVVNFWATWCAPCLKEMPELSALDAMREHVVVVGLAYEEIDVAAMRAFLEARPVVYPVAIVDVYDPPADFETPRGLPMTYLLAPDGTVAKRFLGPVTAAEVEAAIAAAGGPAVPAGQGEAAAG
ncbi:hypothetical protein GCM10028862_11600 [Luteimonas pelagia]